MNKQINKHSDIFGCVAPEFFDEIDKVDNIGMNFTDEFKKCDISTHNIPNLTFDLVEKFIINPLKKSK